MSKIEDVLSGMDKNELRNLYLEAAGKMTCAVCQKPGIACDGKEAVGLIGKGGNDELGIPRTLWMHRDCFMTVVAVAVAKWIVTGEVQQDDSMKKLSDGLASLLWPWDNPIFKDAVDRARKNDGRNRPGATTV